MRLILVDVEEAIEWGQRALAAIANGHETHGVDENGRRWRSHLQAYLRAAGGIADGDDLASRDRDSLPAPRAVEPFTPDFQPARDDRFSGLYNFNFPPHLVYNADRVPPDERNLALLCKRALEMDVPEMMASFMTQRKGQPWEFYYDYSRQLWDEARHQCWGLSH